MQEFALAFVSPLLATVVACDTRWSPIGIALAGQRQGRPITRARAVTGRLAAGIVEHVHRHALIVGENFALSAVAGFGVPSAQMPRP